MYPFRKLTAYICAAFALLIGAYSLYVEYYAEHLQTPVGAKLLIALIFVLALALAACAFCLSTRDREQRKHYIRVFLFIAFAYYLLMIAELLFFDADFVRQPWAHRNNFRPLATIGQYWRGYQNGNVSLYNLTVNLLGNLCAFMPMALFLPLLFRRCRKPWFFALVLLILIAAVELLQMFTGRGSCDIDDLLLNFCGAFLLYLLLYFPLRSLWRRL